MEERKLEDMDVKRNLEGNKMAKGKCKFGRKKTGRHGCLKHERRK